MCAKNKIMEDRGIETALLVGVLKHEKQRCDTEDSLDELAHLAVTAGAQVLDRKIFKQSKPSPAYFIGKGQAAEMAAWVKDRQLSLVVFDDDLSPVQVVI
ncbi:MAG: hypothetical protein GKR87_07405 [Kiritimatiellae bacterium]|nr:hypothetical protein [Kiritimatiellia bacterium]